ncbi:hypothetical protein AVEN_34580-1 [Araneus ventricosus]|uniref:Uncharacterized protein n=1 Tax=Araneus ventricosus TaxID=182803 RepID=A0A4Y2B2U9_ARAVE|nr:hypothetical protein AVEN_34580-1 [Araneus ventricosus]
MITYQTATGLNRFIRLQPRFSPAPRPQTDGPRSSRVEVPNLWYAYPWGAQLTGFLVRTADETLKSFPMDQLYYRSASNSLLAPTTDRTPKTFALQGDPSRSTFRPSSKRSPYIVSRGRP